jgi:pimeloyl-ACP methyl ester carboxylesterase
MELTFREMGSGDPVVIVHGVFGSASNWQSIARRLADSWRFLLVDLRNHGNSPQHPDMNYDVMAEDLSAFIDSHCDGRADLIGHSMGGKVAMTLALTCPERVASLVAVDVAPVLYEHRFTDLIQALCDIDLGQLKRRSDADEQLATTVTERHMRGFLLNNLRQRSSGQWYWRANLAALIAHVDEIADFPAGRGGQVYSGPTLMLRGGLSEYLRDEHWPTINTLFPRASQVTVKNTGHWLHAEQPQVVADHLREFLNDPH